MARQPKPPDTEKLVGSIAQVADLKAFAAIRAAAVARETELLTESRDALLRQVERIDQRLTDLGALNAASARNTTTIRNVTVPAASKPRRAKRARTGAKATPAAGRTATCRDCGSGFPCAAKGKMPVRCPDCKAGKPKPAPAVADRLIDAALNGHIRRLLDEDGPLGVSEIAEKLSQQGIGDGDRARLSSRVSLILCDAANRYARDDDGQWRND